MDAFAVVFELFANFFLDFDGPVVLSDLFDTRFKLIEASPFDLFVSVLLLTDGPDIAAEFAALAAVGRVNVDTRCWA